MIPGLYPTISQFHPKRTLTNLVGRRFDDVESKKVQPGLSGVKQDHKMSQDLFGLSNKKLINKSSEGGRKLIKKQSTEVQLVENKKEEKMQNVEIIEEEKVQEEEHEAVMNISQIDGNDSPVSESEEETPSKRPRSNSQTTEAGPGLQCGLCPGGEGDNEVVLLSTEQQETIKLRRKIAGKEDLDILGLCKKHLKQFKAYEGNHKQNCSNPFAKHMKRVKARGASISLQDARLGMMLKGQAVQSR